MSSKKKSVASKGKVELKNLSPKKDPKGGAGGASNLGRCVAASSLCLKAKGLTTN